MKKLLAISTLAAAMFGLTGCSDTETASTEAVKDEKVIALLISNRSNEFFGVLADSAVKTSEAMGYKIEVYDGGNDATRQPSQVEDAITKGVDAIVINPLNKDATTSVLNDAVARGISVVSVDTTVDGVDFLAEVATDNEDGGKFAAEWLVTKSGINPTELAGIIHMQGLDGHSAHLTRAKGFYDHLISEQAGAEWNALANDESRYVRLTGDFAQDVAQSVLESRLSALDQNGKYVIYNENDVMAVGSLGAIKNDNRFDLNNFYLIGFDGSAEGKRLVDEDSLKITVVQDFQFIGAKAIGIVDNFLKNGQKPEQSSIPVEVVMYPENQSPRI
ncbi:sugar ABC transporter substrate-binding protein [Endozoicomonas ascidiicola]|uniref:sugar ABC transporter substrate-binding protein n=1 Tax=Endozoicomonas ascidiicola TaxID=1698521 RepID=UPI00082A431C|nr:substrate-binding domain-containing protein [Endozoicomonas ascidiicola]USN26981.1 substrate-binding domain-containing protein [synthetic construct]